MSLSLSSTLKNPVFLQLPARTCRVLRHQARLLMLDKAPRGATDAFPGRSRSRRRRRHRHRRRRRVVAAAEVMLLPSEPSSEPKALGLHSRRERQWRDAARVLMVVHFDVSVEHTPNQEKQGEAFQKSEEKFFFLFVFLTKRKSLIKKFLI